MCTEKYTFLYSDIFQNTLINFLRYCFDVYTNTK